MCSCLVISLFSFQGGLNLTASTRQQQLSDNSSVQDIVKDYVRSFTGLYNVSCNVFMILHRTVTHVSLKE